MGKQRGLSLAEKREKVLSVFAAPDALFFTEKVRTRVPQRPPRASGVMLGRAHAQFCSAHAREWAWSAARAVHGTGSEPNLDASFPSSARLPPIPPERVNMRYCRGGRLQKEASANGVQPKKANAGGSQANAPSCPMLAAHAPRRAPPAA